MIGSPALRLQAVTALDAEGRRWRDGETATYQIVGGGELDEARRGRISYEAPLARALLGKHEGDAVVEGQPAGEVEATVVRVEWK